MIRRRCARAHFIALRSTKAPISSIHHFSLKSVTQTASLTLAIGMCYVYWCGRRPFTTSIYLYMQRTKYSTQTTFWQISFRILGNDNILDLFTIDTHTGQLFIKDTMALDVNHLKSESILFSVQVISIVVH